MSLLDGLKQFPVVGQGPLLEGCRTCSIRVPSIDIPIAHYLKFHRQTVDILAHLINVLRCYMASNEASDSKQGTG